MPRPTRIHIDATALLHNVGRVKQFAPEKKIIAMVKANAYGCGLSSVIPVLEGHVDTFGVACLEEALSIRELGSRTDCLLLQGVFSAEEWQYVASQGIQCVIHETRQLQWLLTTPLNSKIKIWIKINTGMQRLGFFPDELAGVMSALLECPWVDKEIVVMTHLACADEPESKSNQEQLQSFNSLSLPNTNKRITRSIANSAAIMALSETHADIVRPGIMLYGISPFINKTGRELGLMPVMHLLSAVSAIHVYPPHSPVGYGGTWQSDKPARIGVVAIGYGDGYPRHISPNTLVWVNGDFAPIVGRVSMDMLTIDLTARPDVEMGAEVELWGEHVPVELVAKSAGTIAYELLCQITARVRQS